MGMGKGVRLIAWAAVTTLLLAGIAPVRAFAQVRSPNIPKEITPDMMEKVYQAVGDRLHINPHGIEVKRIFGMAPPAKKTWTQDMQVVKILRGKNGVRFPERKDLALKIDPQTFIPELKKDIEQANAKVVERLKSAPPPPTCRRNFTSKEKTVTGEIPRDKIDKVVLDMLFISKEDMPPDLDPNEAFGPMTFVRVIDTSEPQLASLAMQSAGAPCLPFRFRVTSTMRYFDEGLNAVMNYGAHPNNKGKLSQSLSFLRNRYP